MVKKGENVRWDGGKKGPKSTCRFFLLAGTPIRESGLQLISEKHRTDLPTYPPIEHYESNFSSGIERSPPMAQVTVWRIRNLRVPGSIPGVRCSIVKARPPSLAPRPGGTTLLSPAWSTAQRRSDHLRLTNDETPSLSMRRRPPSPVCRGGGSR